MHILYYSTSYHAKHGGSIQSIEFFRELNKIDKVTKCTLFPKITKYPNYKYATRISFKIILKKIPFLQLLFFYRRNMFYVMELLEELKQNTPDVIIMQIDSNFLQIRKIRKLYPKILICTQINGSPFDEPFKNIAFKRFFHKSQREAYNLCDLNIFISDFSRKRIMGNLINDARDIVIHNGTDPKKFFPISESLNLRQKWNYPLNKFIIGYIGTLDFHKQLGVLIDVFDELLKENPKLYMVIIGDGPALGKLIEKVNKLGLTENIQFSGWIPHDDINENLNCFDLAVHHYANTYMNPLKIFEYLSAGLPVIAPDIPSVRAIFRDREDLLITGSSHLELKKVMYEVLNNENLRKKLSNNDHLIHEIEGNYTWKKYTDSIISEIKGKLNPNSHD